MAVPKKREEFETREDYVAYLESLVYAESTLETPQNALKDDYQEAREFHQAWRNYLAYGALERDEMMDAAELYGANAVTASSLMIIVSIYRIWWAIIMEFQYNRYRKGYK